VSAELKKAFEKASQDIKSLPDQPNEVLLKLYGLYKQATLGDVDGKRPGFLDLRGRAKYDAWSELKGQSQEQAMKSYLTYAESLISKK
jgi:diazepam-binding inhibitor (GABA receptor modulating acyl-CoA-binding protein)